MTPPDPITLCQAANFAAQAYNAKGIGDGWVQFSDQETGAEVSIQLIGSRLFVVFTGTEPGDMRDWYTNVKASGRYWGVLEGDVHSGFLKAYMSIRDKVLNEILLNLYKSYNVRVICIGHSLGGALASLCQADMMAYSDNVHSITFGAPALFSKKSAKQFDRHCVKYATRVVYFSDLVPRIAFFAGWRHAGPMLYYDPKGVRYTTGQSIKAFSDFLKYSVSKLRILRDAFKSHSYSMYTKVVCAGI
jgi:hypothetical protein